MPRCVTAPRSLFLLMLAALTAASLLCVPRIARTAAAAAVAKVTSGISYLESVAPRLLGTPIAQTTGLDDSLLITG